MKIARIRSVVGSRLMWALIAAMPTVSMAAASEEAPRSAAGEAGYKLGYWMGMTCPLIGLGLIVLIAILMIRRERKFDRDNDDRRDGRGRR